MPGERPLGLRQEPLEVVFLLRHAHHRAPGTPAGHPPATRVPPASPRGPPGRMATMTLLPGYPDAPVHPEYDEDVSRVRDAFLAADYTADGVSGLLGEVAHAALSRQESVPARRAAAGADAPGRPRAAVPARRSHRGRGRRRGASPGVGRAAGAGRGPPTGRDRPGPPGRPAVRRRFLRRVRPRLRPGRGRAAGAARPRPRHRRRVRLPGRPDRARAGGSRPRPRHGLRRAGAAPRPARPVGDRHGRPAPRAGAHPARRRPVRTSGSSCAWAACSSPSRGSGST